MYVIIRTKDIYRVILWVSVRGSNTWLGCNEIGIWGYRIGLSWGVDLSGIRVSICGSDMGWGWD